MILHYLLGRSGSQDAGSQVLDALLKTELRGFHVAPLSMAAKHLFVTVTNHIKNHLYCVQGTGKLALVGLSNDTKRRRIEQHNHAIVDVDCLRIVAGYLAQGTKEQLEKIGLAEAILQQQ